MKKILFALIALLGITACEQVNVESNNESIKLSVDNTEIYANGTQAATFSVVNDKGEALNDATIYFSDTNEALEGNTFKTKYAGEYKFYAKRGNSKSNIVKVVAKEVTEQTKVVTLSFAPTGDIVIGQSVTFAVDCNGEDMTSQSVIYNAANNSALEGNTFTSQSAGEFSFYAMYDDVKSNNVTVCFVAAEEPAKKEYVLSVAPASIKADGQEKAVFTLKQDGKAVANFEVYNAADDSKLASTEFTTEEAGVYAFYAVYNNQKSNTVEVTARMNIVEEEKPIVLAASATTIKANGVESVKFTVSQDGADVTNASAIYVNGGKLNGNKFSTTTPGTYTVYAEKGSMKSEELTITAEEVTDTGRTIVFADGVTISSGWYDVNKKGAGDNGDINMCWAAAASNMIQWFQDRYVAQGGTLPAGAIDGPGTKYYGNFAPYELALMELYHDGWNNNKGGHVEQAIPWYFENKLNGGEYASAGSQAVPLVDGGYWKSIWSEVQKYMYCGYDYFSYDTFSTAYTYTVCYNNYYLWGQGSDLKGQERLKYVSDLIVTAFEHGMASLTVSLSADIMSLHHAVTIWGYEIDNATGLLTRVWLTDSDDFDREPKTQLLNEYSVSIGDGNSHPKFTGSTRYGAIYLVSIHPFAGYKKN